MAAPVPPMAAAQQPMPQREKRERGDRGQEVRDKAWERNQQNRNVNPGVSHFGPPPGAHGPPSERLNGGGEILKVW